MKSMFMAVVAIAGGAAVGAVGMGSYNVFFGDGAVSEEVAHEGEEGQDTLSSNETPPTSEFAGEESEDPAAGVAQVAEGSESGAVQDSTSAPPEPIASVATTPVEVIPPPDPDSLARVQANYQRLARIFAAMDAAEAAPVLAQLDDGQLEGILMAMQGRNAAPILEEMDPERVASLSRKVLGGNE